MSTYIILLEIDKLPKNRYETKFDKYPKKRHSSQLLFWVLTKSILKNIFR